MLWCTGGHMSTVLEDRLKRVKWTAVAIEVRDICMPFAYWYGHTTEPRQFIDFSYWVFLINRHYYLDIDRVIDYFVVIIRLVTCGIFRNDCEFLIIL